MIPYQKRQSCTEEQLATMQKGKIRGVATQGSSGNYDNTINKGALDTYGLKSSTTGSGSYGASKEYSVPIPIMHHPIMQVHIQRVLYNCHVCMAMGIEEEPIMIWSMTT